MSNSADTWDVLVAGAGHNSLICAAYLARAGLRVLVLEANSEIGGNTFTEELILPGYHFDRGSSAHVLFQSSPTFRNNELKLEQYGLRYFYPDPIVTMPFEDGTSLTMWQDPQRTAAEFARFSEHDAHAYREMLSDYDRVKKVYGQNRYTPVGYGPSLEEALSALPDGPFWKRRHRQSALDVIQEYLEDEHTRTFMLWLASLTAQPVDAPYTGILAYSIAYGRQQNSWATPEGGSGALPQALKRLITENGGKILTGKQVTELILEDGHCRGVRTADGASYQAEKAVVSTIHIRQLVDMAPAEAWGQDFVDYISGWQSGFTYFVAHYATNEPPQFLIHGEYRTCSAAGIAGSTDNLIQLMADMRKGVIHHDTPILLVACPSLVDPSRAPAGKHTVRVMSVFPYDLKDGGPERWDEIKNDVAAKDLQYLRNFVPNLTDDVILGKYVDSPLDLERRNLHNWRGSGHGGEATPAQSGAMRPAPGWATYRMPIPGLYQTGATTHPGGSVSAAPGRNAAWVILEDLGLSLDEAIKE